MACCQGARGDAVIGAGQIRLGDLQVEHRLAFGVVPSLDNLLCGLGAGRAKAGAFAGAGVHAIERVTQNATTS